MCLLVCFFKWNVSDSLTGLCLFNLCKHSVCSRGYLCEWMNQWINQLKVLYCCIAIHLGFLWGQRPYLFFFCLPHLRVLTLWCKVDLLMYKQITYNYSLSLYGFLTVSKLWYNFYFATFKGLHKVFNILILIFYYL